MTRGASTPSPRRRYDSAARDAAARETRARILDAARRLLVDGGYPALSVAALARAAEVSPQTIYNSIGGKAEVLKACYDVTLAGDDAPVPMAERPEFVAMFEAADGGGFLDAYAAWCRVVYERTAPIIGAVSAPGIGDSGARTFAETIEQERRTGTTHAMTALRERHGIAAGLSTTRAVDVAWTLNAPEVYDRLVHRCGWSPSEYEHWLAGQLKAALLKGG